MTAVYQVTMMWSGYVAMILIQGPIGYHSPPQRSYPLEQYVAKTNSNPQCGDLVVVDVDGYILGLHVEPADVGN